MAEEFVVTIDHPYEVTPADVPRYSPGNVWLDTTGRGSDPITMRGISFQPSQIRAPGVLAHLLVLYRSGETMMTRRLAGLASSAAIGPGDVSLMTSGCASEWAWPGEIDVLHLYLDRAKLNDVAGAMCGRGVEHVALRDILKVNDDFLTHMGQLLIDERASE